MLIHTLLTGRFIVVWHAILGVLMAFVLFFSPAQLTPQIAATIPAAPTALAAP